MTMIVKLDNREVIGKCLRPGMTDDEIWNNVREAIARRGYQVGDFTLTSREPVTTPKGQTDPCVFRGIIETNAPHNTHAAWGDLELLTGLACLSAVEQKELESIQAKAKVRHEKARKAAAKRGRKDYPMLPYECSWAFEQEFRREKQGYNWVGR
jgi:hypothetical protein